MIRDLLSKMNAWLLSLLLSKVEISFRKGIEILKCVWGVQADSLVLHLLTID
jgi:hypothetical protein